MIALIPARGGSKGLPGKNIRPLCGRPLIEYVIQLALDCPSMTRVIVSTDSEDIAKVAKGAGAEIPFLRPRELAGDESLALETYLYTCERLMREEKMKIDSFSVMLPTSPLGTVEDIEGAIKLFNDKAADSVLTVVENEHPIEFSLTLNTDRSLNHRLDRPPLANHQQLPKTYRANGVLYVFRYDFLKASRNYFSTRSFGYLMPPERSADINVLCDFLFAEFLMEQHRNGVFATRHEKNSARS